MGRMKSLPLAATLALLLGACNLPGGGSGGVSLSGEESKPVDQIIADAQKDMGGFKTVHLIFNTTTRDAGAITFDISADESGNVAGSGATGDAKFDIVVVDGHTYIKGQAFWAKVFSNGTVADPTVQQLIQAKIGDHWVAGLDSVGDAAARNSLSPAVLADCLSIHGALSTAGTQTINGRKAVEIKDKGDSPGGRAGSRFIAVDSPHVLLRLIANGPTTAGSTPSNGKCKGSATPAPAPAPSGTPSSDLGAVTIDYSDYGKSVSVVKPTDTVDLTRLFATP